MMSANLRSFLFLIRWCEDTSGPDGYRTIVGGELFTDYSDHPRKLKTGTFANGKAWKSTAAGAYQFLQGTWDECRNTLDLPDFSPESQDRAAVFLIKRRGALHAVEEGNLDQAIQILNKEWASLPGSPYGQPTKSLEACKVIFTRAGGTLMQVGGATPSAPPPPTPAEPAPSVGDRIMAIPALVTAAASALLPLVVDLFKARGTKTSERNAEVVEAVGPTLIAIAKEVVGSGGNEQQVAESILANKDLQAQFRAAVALQWKDLEPFLTFEEESRKSAREFVTHLAGDGPEWRQIGAAVIVATLSLIIVGGGGVLFWTMMDSPMLDPGQKGLILGALIAAFGQAIGFWFGSSAQSRAKDSTIAEQARR